jgi:hypothetical protein
VSLVEIRWSQHIVAWFVLAECIATTHALGQVVPRRERTLELSLSRHGFNTPIVTVQEGPLILIVNNRSGLSALNVTLDHVKDHMGRLPPVSQVLEEVTLRTNGLPFRRRLLLAPGEYTLRDSTNPRFVCTVTVIGGTK